MNSEITEACPTAPNAQEKRIGFFERYLSVWVALCMSVGVLLGKLVACRNQIITTDAMGDI